MIRCFITDIGNVKQAGLEGFQAYLPQANKHRATAMKSIKRKTEFIMGLRFY